MVDTKEKGTLAPGPRGRGVQRFFLEPIYDLADGLARQLVGHERRGMMAFAIVLTAVITWFIYVPIHELLHVAGCVLTGGTVTELQLDAKYGGTLLAKVFDFVKPGSEYAGQLTGFDTGGSDLVYLATDFGPFVLSIIPGIPLLKLAARRRSAIIFGISLVVGLAPLTNLPGDYFEMGSIVATRIGMSAGYLDAAVCEAMRSDDVFKLVEELAGGEGVLAGVGMLASVVTVSVSAILAILFAWGTYWVGVWCSLLFERRTPGPTPSA